MPNQPQYDYRGYKAYILHLVFALISNGFAAYTAFAQSDSAAERNVVVSDFTKNMAALNQYSPMEPAGSRGSIGIGLGAGMDSTSQTTYDQLHRAELGIAGTNTQTKMNAQKVYFIKGIFSPLDVGLTASAYEKTNAKSIGAHAQVTLYEGFQMPAISVRASHAQMVGLAASKLTSNSADLGVSYGLLRFISIYAGLGMSRHTGSTELSSGQDTSYLLNDGETKAKIKTELDEQYRYAGLNLRFLPPFVSGTIESRTSGNSLESIAAKISVGI